MFVLVQTDHAFLRLVHWNWPGYRKSAFLGFELQKCFIIASIKDVNVYFNNILYGEKDFTVLREKNRLLQALHFFFSFMMKVKS